MIPRSIQQIVTAHQQKEGAGFLVRRPVPTSGLDQVDPFLMLDEVGSVVYAPGKAIGAPDHPHRGFETVSYILSGQKLHEDSTGKTQLISAGDVQWMTAGAGIVHSELPGPAFKAAGGLAHGFQIWVNLPAAEKFAEPGYQYLPASQIPQAQSPDGPDRHHRRRRRGVRRCCGHRHAHAHLAAGLAGFAGGKSRDRHQPQL